MIANKEKNTIQMLTWYKKILLDWPNSSVSLYDLEAQYPVTPLMQFLVESAYMLDHDNYLLEPIQRLVENHISNLDTSIKHQEELWELLRLALDTTTYTLLEDFNWNLSGDETGISATLESKNELYISFLLQSNGYRVDWIKSTDRVYKFQDESYNEPLKVLRELLAKESDNKRY